MLMTNTGEIPKLSVMRIKVLLYRYRERGAGGPGAHPPIILDLSRIGWKRCFVPRQYRITDGAPLPSPKSQSYSAVPEVSVVLTNLRLKMTRLTAFEREEIATK